MKLPLLATALAPVAAAMLFFYLYDRYDREPIRLLIKVMLAGALMVIPTVWVESFLSALNPFTGTAAIAFTAFVVAGLTEEYFKRLAVLKSIYHHQAYNDKLDGILYAAAAALGFAGIENISYVFQMSSEFPQIALMRAILAVPAHMLFGVTMGFYLSIAKYGTTEAERAKGRFRSWIFPAILHGIYDFILMSQNEILMVLFIPFVIYLWIVNIRKLRKYKREARMTYLR